MLNCEMQNADWDGLALGALTPQAAAPLVSHLRAGCDKCGLLFSQSQAAVLALGASLPGQAPSQLVEDKLSAYVGKPGVTTKRPNWAPWLVAAASVAAAIWMGSQRPAPPSVAPPRKIVTERIVDPNPALQKRILELEQRLSQAKPVPVVVAAAPIAPVPPPQEPVVVKVEDPEKDRQLNAYREKIQQLEAQNQSQQKLLAEAAQSKDKKLEQMTLRLTGLESETLAQRKILEDYRNAFRTIESSGMRQIELASVDPAAQNSSARALYSRQGGLLLLAHDLPKLTGQKCYQLWILRKGSPSIVSGGLIKLDAQGRGFLQSPPTPALNDATGFAITDEPLGGSVVARGHKLLFGAL